jgi:hypothetical protein
MASASENPISAMLPEHGAAMPSMAMPQTAIYWPIALNHGNEYR